MGQVILLTPLPICRGGVADAAPACQRNPLRGTLLLASSHMWVAQGHHARAPKAVGRVLAYEQKVKGDSANAKLPELIPRL